MAEQAARLVDAVLPFVPVRQWVLTVPHRLRYRLAFDHVLCRAVLGVLVRVVLGWYRRRGRRAGVPDGRNGEGRPRRSTRLEQEPYRLPALGRRRPSVPPGSRQVHGSAPPGPPGASRPLTIPSLPEV